MGTLSYSATVSLDGYVADASGDFPWAAPSAEVFAFHIERMSEVSTEILGRNTFLLMKYWEAEPDAGSWGDAEHEFARRWLNSECVVASSTLAREEVGSERVRLIPELSLADLKQIVEEAPREVEIFGPTTASAAIRAGLVQDFRFLTVPHLVGGGLSAFPEGTRLDLSLVEHRVFANGTVYHRYQPR